MKKSLLFLSAVLLASTAHAGFTETVDHAFQVVNDWVKSVFFFNILFFVPGVDLPLVLAWLLAGALFFTIYLRFFNLRGFKHAIDLTLGHYDVDGAKGDVNHMKALAAALSGTLGLGNISGVAIAIASGGPGAAFWIWIAGFIGMSSKFAECTLAQMYREKRADGVILGGPMLYLEKGFAKRGYVRLGKFLSVTFALICILGTYGGGGAFQVNQSLYALGEMMPFWLTYKWLYGLILAVLVAVVTIGGIRRIANVAIKVVPFMCISYLLMGAVVIAVDSAAVPHAMWLIVSQAFHPEAMYGGALGVLMLGFRRAAFSNEAGIGSASIAHSTAKVVNPVEEGTVSLLEPFIDTVVICTMTSLVLVITGAYNNPEYSNLIHGDNGAALTLRAFGTVSSYFPIMMCLIVFLFAFCTVISWSYYGERCFTYLFGEKYNIIYNILLVTVLFLGAIASSTHIMDFGDYMILGMGFPNLIGVFVMRREILDALNKYWERLKSGKMQRTQ